MVKRTGGFRKKTRHKLRKNVRERGKVSINAYLQQFTPGDRVELRVEPAIQGGMYHPRFHGKVGTIQKQQGECYHVAIKDFRKEKVVLVHPVHLRKLQVASS